jgi:outer membrane murein-binding lipoprotein Lpp
MDSSIKQFITVVIAVLVGTLLIAFVNSDAFKNKIETGIATQIDSLLEDGE